ncbi:MAG: hypothetical protein KA998_05355 [Rickettsiaceae bacterium]|nr:hypothetical protein [Rickettsiaceae bacterium]
MSENNSDNINKAPLAKNKRRRPSKNFDRSSEALRANLLRRKEVCKTKNNDNSQEIK